MFTKASGIENYVRLLWDNTPVYVYPDKPDWFVPTKKADELLCSINNGSYSPKNSKDFFISEIFLSSLERPRAKKYSGRASKLKLDKLKECWFHITNQCNLSCCHCLFSSNPHDKTALPLQSVLSSIDEVQKLGCKIFYFTGGEPFIYEGFEQVVKKIMEIPENHVVILTNGLLINDNFSWLEAVDRKRIHLQISLDGTKERNNEIRGDGTYKKIIEAVRILINKQFNVSLSMLVENSNVSDMSSLVDIAAEYNVGNIHYMWFFQKGKGACEAPPDPNEITKELLTAYGKAKEKGISIDNIESLKSQIFSLPGTKYDLSNAGWESIAIGSDEKIYPSAALVGQSNTISGDISDGIENIWQNSNMLKKVREVSLIDNNQYNSNPLRFLTGGGDIDQSFVKSGNIGGHDPYLEVYNNLALKLISEQARQYKDDGKRIGLLSRMGECIYKCDGEMGEVSFTHSNCVLSLAVNDGHSLARAFYSAAAEEPNKEIFNPVVFDESQIAHIPQESRIRSYGCGSPVFDAEIQEGETVLDLGSGTGVECFIAAKKVGVDGKVIGIDMSDTMIKVANKSKEKVVENLGYDNIQFVKAYFEEAPVKGNTTDVLISNCVLNLSPDKRKTFCQIYRMLKPGGRAIISDICYEQDIPLEIKYNEKLRGECIGGAFKQDELFTLLRDIEFESIKIIKRFPYRQVAGYNFYSITYSLKKPEKRREINVLYRGPFTALITEDGEIIKRGKTQKIKINGNFSDGDSLFVLDDLGQVTNVEQLSSCCCLNPSENNPEKHSSGCMVCGSDLTYSQQEQTKNCYYCGKQSSTNAVCNNGHFVCDNCHAHDAVNIIRKVCFSTDETDMIALMKKIRSHKAFPVNGPEHHSMVPAIILTTYKNATGKLSNEQINTSIERGGTVTGGSCGFSGTCGAAIGVGIAFSIITEADPYKAKQRQNVLQVTSQVLSEIAKNKAPRCCQRDCWIAIMEASKLSEKYLGVHLKVNEEIKCCQREQNEGCIRKACPLWNE